MAAAFDQNIWCSNNVYGILWSNINLHPNIQGFTFGGTASTTFGSAANANRFMSQSSPTFSSSDGKKWIANLVSFYGQNQTQSNFEYTLEIISATECKMKDKKLILNNCFSHSVHPLSNSHAQVAFNLKNTMQTPCILLYSDQPFCSLRIEIRCSEISPKLPVDSIPAYKRMLSYISNLLEDNEFCDIVLKVGGETFPAHKCILAAQSEVFQAMFRSDMKEKNTGTVEIQNWDPQTVKVMLKFMYTQEDPVFSNVETAMAIYGLSHFYGVKGLFDFALAYLLSSVNETNVLDLLMHGADYSDDTLKKTAMHYLTKHPKSISNSEKCVALVQKHPCLFEFVFKCLGE